METSPSPSPPSLVEFPDDVQICILSFLRCADVASVACTCRRFAALCGEERLWIAVCDRRWGSKTQIRRWIRHGGDLSFNFRALFKILSRWESLIGFWRRIGRGDEGTPPLVFFEWGPSFITGSRVSPSGDPGSYDVVKIPFIWMSLSPLGDPICLVRLSLRLDSAEFLGNLADGSGFADSDMVPVTVCFMGENHFVVDECRGQQSGLRMNDEFGSCEDLAGLEASSPPEKVMADIYQHFANRVSPCRDKSFRKQKKKRGKDRTGRRTWESEHFVRISDCYPTSRRPLQGLWKGICESMSLGFYLITYDEVGGIACRKVGDASEPISGYSPVLWTSNRSFLERPFSKEEEDLYVSGNHTHPFSSSSVDPERSVSRILSIKYSYGIISSANMKNEEGRVWEYSTGKFGFGVLRSGHIVDLRHIAIDGCLLDSVKLPCTSLCS
ncbi:F-box family protein [Wolffia australiana]